MRKNCFLAVLFAFIFTFSQLLPQQAAYASGQYTSQTENKDGKPSDDKKEDKYPDYKKYLTDANELSIEPEPYLFGQLVNVLKNQFYGNVTEEGLITSVKSEIARLYKAAGKTNPIENRTFTSINQIYEETLKTGDGIIPGNLLVYASISGLLKGTGDPYTTYLTPKEFKQMQESLQSSSFAGIGIVIELDKDHDNALTIIEPIEDTPAWKAGLKSGDVIAEIDGSHTKGMDIELCSSKLRGPKDSTVILTIKRKGITGTRKYTLQRDTITMKSIASKTLDSDIGYIKLRTFGERTGKEFETALNSLQESGIKGLIIDLRNNGGGYVNAAINISNIFLPKDEKIVSVKNKQGKEAPKLSRNSSPNTLPLVILVNKYSASASEITAGALKDHKRAVLVGAKTFGKGSVQQVVPMKDGSAMKITVAHYTTPDGSDIDKKGLEPDYPVELDPKNMGTDKDEQMQKAVDILKKNIAIK